MTSSPPNGQNITSRQERYAKLKVDLQTYGSVVIAFSGGVDSTFLLKVAIDVLGPEAVLALTATSPTYPEFEFREACRQAVRFGARQLVVESNELEIPGFAANDRRRCYHCKSELFNLCRDNARKLGYVEVLDGSNLDDLQDLRPGRDAAAELAVRPPLLEVGLGKQTFACRSARFPYGTEITAERAAPDRPLRNFFTRTGFRKLSGSLSW